MGRLLGCAFASCVEQLRKKEFVEQVLKDKVEAMIAEANRKYRPDGIFPDRNLANAELRLPLIRLRVEQPAEIWFQPGT